MPLRLRSMSPPMTTTRRGAEGSRDFDDDTQIRGEMLLVKWLRRLIVLVLLAGLVFVSSTLPDANSVLVNVDLLFWQAPPMELWLALGSSFLIGVLCASAGLLYQLAKKSLVARRYRKTVVGLESEIHQLRNLPLAGSEMANGGTAEDSPVPGTP